MHWAVGQSQFEWLANHKHHQKLFNSYMASRREGRPSWFDIYPVDTLFKDSNSNSGSVFLVDVGGNQGHDLKSFHQAYPSAPGGLVLQDLPDVISSMSTPGFEKMEYSFWDPQPVKGILLSR